MTPALWREVREALGRVLETDPENRAALLAQSDRQVREEVEALLACDTDPHLNTRGPASLLEFAEAEQPVRFGPYRIISEIGRGGMGIVYLAERDDGQFERRVAIKLLPAVFRGREMEQWFARERAILARLEHPGIARLLDGGVSPVGQPFLIMEYVEGLPLTAHARNQKLAGRLRLFLDVCAALSYAHGKLVVHGDVKPGNVLVDGEGRAKLLDFGLASMLGPDGGSVPGADTQSRPMTPAYASPEQVRGEPLGVTADVFSLGVVLCELITGTRPTGHAAPAGNRDLDAIVAKALAPEPAHRYASVEELARDVRAYLEQRPVSARPRHAIHSAWKFVQRHPWGMGLGVAALLAISITGTLAWREAARTRRQFDQSRKLANSVLFELHDSIASLQGSTRARELVVRRATEYLEALSHESQNNAGLRRELAKGYLRLANVTGNSDDGSMGNSKAALTSYGKSIQLFEGLLREFPGDPDLVDNLGTAYRNSGYAFLENTRVAEAQSSFEKALNLERMRVQAGGKADLATEAKNHYALAAALVHLRDYSRAQAEYSAALTLFEQLATQQSTPAALRNLALCHKRLGALHGTVGAYPKALAEYTLAEALDERVVAAMPTQRQASLDLSYSYSDHSFYLVKVGNLSDAFAQNEKALAIRVRLSAADTADARAALAAARSFRNRARILDLQDRPLEALPNFVECARRLAQLSVPGRRDSVADLQNQGEAEYELARLLTKLGRKQEAASHWKAALSLWDPLAKRGVLSKGDLSSLAEIRRNLL